MFCPNCGQKANLEQVYCRSCGVGLGETSHKLSKFYSELEEKIDWFRRAGLFSTGLVLAGTLFALFSIAINEMQLGKLLSLLVVCSVPAVLAGVVFVLYYEKIHSKKVKKELIEDKNLAPPIIETRMTNRQLNESSFQPIGSVTENTTELFVAKIHQARTSGELG